jgi:Methyltransferase domain
MAKFNLVTIRPRGFLHSSASAEVRESLAWSLTALGHEAIVSESAFAQGPVTNIVFCAELLPPNSPIPADAIIFNLEQPSHPAMENIRKLAAGHTVWDYSSINVANWKSWGFDVRHVPIGYTPNLTRIPKAVSQDIDVLFYGWLTERRAKLGNALTAAGLRIVFTDCSYGGSRDQLISRSKVCLNVAHDGRTQFNIVRVSFLAANHKCVISETASDMDSYSRLLCVWSEYSDLVSGCRMMVDKHTGFESGCRQQQEELAFQEFSRQDFTSIVARALSAPAAVAVAPAAGTVDSNKSSTAILDRYKRGCISGDMVDFLPWLREHARGQILEIGTRDGASTSAFLLGLADHDPSGHLISVDTTDCSGLWNHPQWTFHHGNSLQVQFKDATFDVILIDGDHSRSAYVGDLYNSYHWVRPGGLILSHDIVPERGHEFYAVGLREEYFKFADEMKLEHWELPGRHGMGVMKKPA